jgi:hypothetical protein
MFGELHDELLADHARCPENPHVNAFHLRSPVIRVAPARKNKNAGLFVRAGVWLTPFG